MKKLFFLSFVFLFLLQIKSFSQQDVINLSWVKTLLGSDYGKAVKIEADKNGNVYLLGEYKGNVDFDPSGGVYSIANVSGFESYIAKYDSLGNFIWVKDFAFQIKSFETDNHSNLYISGYFKDSIDVDPSPNIYKLLAYSEYFDGFFAKLDSSCNLKWANSFGGINSLASCTSLSVDYSGNVCIIGGFRGKVDFDPSGNTAFVMSSDSVNFDNFVAKYDSLGNYKWIKNFGVLSNYSSEGVVNIKNDHNNDILISGSFRGKRDFNKTNPNIDTLDSYHGGGFVLKLDVNGNFQFVKQRDSDSQDMVIDTNNSIYSVGGFIHCMFLGTVWNYNISKYDPSGNVCFDKKYLSNYDAVGISCALDSSGNLYVSGVFRKTLDLTLISGETVNISTGGNTNMNSFLAKYNSFGDLLSVDRIASIGDNQVYTITCDSKNNLLVAGSLNKTSDFDFTVGQVFASPWNPTHNGFFAKYKNCRTAPINVISSFPILCSGEETTISVSGGSGTYLWSTGSSDSTLILAPNTTTLYEVSCTDTKGCTITRKYNQIVNDCTFLDEIAATLASVKIYPNPNSGSFTIKTEEKMDITILNEIGQEIKKIKLNEFNFYNETFESFSNGIYFLIGKNGNEISKHKIIVQK